MKRANPVSMENVALLHLITREHADRELYKIYHNLSRIGSQRYYILFYIPYFTLCTLDPDSLTHKTYMHTYLFMYLFVIYIAFRVYRYIVFTTVTLN